MIPGKLSRRYAAALFQLATDQNNVEQIGAEIERFHALCYSTPLGAALSNPAFSVRDRKNVAVRTAEQLRLSRLAIHFLSILIDRDRLTSLGAIVAFYRRLEDEARGRVKAKILTATPLESEISDQLRSALQKISGKEVLLAEETDPALLGGLVLHLEGRIYDGSVRMQLEQLRRRIEQA